MVSISWPKYNESNTMLMFSLEFKSNKNSAEYYLCHQLFSCPKLIIIILLPSLTGTCKGVQFSQVWFEGCYIR